MPLIRRWKATPLLRQLAILLCAAIVIIGGLVIALVALYSANSTHDDLRGSVGCLNNALGDRNGPTTKDAAAHIAVAAAEISFAERGKAYDSALVTVLVTPKGPGQLKAFKAFVLAAQSKQAADVTYVTQLHRYVKQLRADQRYRTLHPLGRC